MLMFRVWLARLALRLGSRLVRSVWSDIEESRVCSSLLAMGTRH